MAKLEMHGGAVSLSLGHVLVVKQGFGAPTFSKKLRGTLDLCQSLVGCERSHGVSATVVMSDLGISQQSNLDQSVHNCGFVTELAQPVAELLL